MATETENVIMYHEVLACDTSCKHIWTRIKKEVDNSKDLIRSTYRCAKCLQTRRTVNMIAKAKKSRKTSR